MISTSGGFGIQVMAEICHKCLDGFGMPAEWALSIVVPIFMGVGDIRNCCCYGAVMLLKHGMKVVGKGARKKLRRIVIVVEMQFGFMPESGRTYAVSILTRLQEEYHAKGKK